MKRSCAYCGRIHEYSYVCPKKPKPKSRHKDIEIAKFRSGKLWRAKSREITERDKGLCVVCRLGLFGEAADLIPADSVHHIVPLADDFERRLDNDNLISLCAYHHELAERGELPAEELARAIEQIEERSIPPGGACVFG